MLVRKKDGSLRMCVDYQLLNAKTHRDAFPLPRIDESFDAMRGSKWFTTLDLASGYHQIAMDESDQEKTAFVTPMGLYEFTRMPFGLSGSPATFQRLMQRCFGDQCYQTVLCYLDDIIIFSSTFDNHLERVEMVLQRLQKIGLKLKTTKCHFLQQQVLYLGHQVSADGIATDPEKIAAVKDWAVPNTIKQLRSFVGFVSYYRKYVLGSMSMIEENGVLYRKVCTPQGGEVKQLVLPRVLKPQLLEAVHDRMGHQGRQNHQPRLESLLLASHAS